LTKFTTYRKGNEIMVTEADVDATPQKWAVYISSSS